MSAKHSPRKITLAMIKGKPIATSVPVIHYHASDDELEEIYPSTDEEKQLTPECEKISSKVTSSPSRCIHESDISENNSETRSVSAENILLEGTPPSLDPWKVFSDIKGKITKTFEEKLSEIKSDKKKRRNSKAESSSISDLEDQGCVTPCDEKADDIRKRGNATRYVGFSEVKTGLKDKSLQDESVESGIEASEFSQNVSEDVASLANDPSNSEPPCNNNNYTVFPQQSYTYPVAFSKKIDFKTVFSQLIKQLIRQATYKSIAAFIAISCIYYVIPLAEYLLGFMMGVFVTVTFYDIVTKLKKILTTMPDEGCLPSPPIPILEIPAVEEHAVVERYQGWLNELPYKYEPNNYHVARTKSVFFRLEGNILRIMETRMKVPKKAVWDEPKHKLKFVKKRVYNLTEAKIELLPCGLIKRRRWSKKYPICITLGKKALICNVILKSTTNDECSINSYKVDLKEKVGCKSNKKYTKKLDGDMQDENEILLVNMEHEEPIVRQEISEFVEMEDTDEDDDDNKNYDYDSASDYFDNECVKYEDCFVNSKETEKHEEEKLKKKKKDYKVQQKEEDRIKGDLKKSYTRTVKKRKKRKDIPSETKTCKKSIITTWSKRKDDWEEDEEEEEEEDEEETEDEEEEEGKKITMKINVEKDNEEKEKSGRKERQELEKLEGEDEEAATDNYDSYYHDRVHKKKKRNRKNEEEDEEEEEEEEEEEDELEEEDEREGEEDEEEEHYNDDEGKNKLKIFIFARTDREKEDWYRRLVLAASRSVKKNDSLLFTIDVSSNISSSQSSTQHKIVSAESKSSFSANNSHETVPELTYNAYMAKYMDSNCSPMSEGAISTSAESTLWINCLIARILFDVRKCPETIHLIQDKIQRKLSNIKLPYFMECLLVSEMTIGQAAPVIHSVTKPVINERGLWLDLDITYKGSLTMTVETKLNLMKLTRTGSVPDDTIISTKKPNEVVTRSPIFDSDVEDTPETSTEDDCDNSRTQSYNVTKETTSTQSSGRKFLSMVDKIAANKYFQHATELSYVRRAMEGVSNTEIRLMVTVSSIEGCLSLNIPPAPSDRLWYGFKPVPKVSLTVKPAVGERTVNIVYITKWIETKLLREFEKVVVLPNMDDLILPLCPNYPYTTMR
ncbi:hypothetical protein K0M31_019496 [Melipona bicolor]|uniref:SMP-LTD domain-containing protein n=1 Tax=Melipona bicolor TaxID=60889 RepID=A0AA40G3F1_9HYME|nr:hypothetical protein K0M31_019496 [Melipona bicolor]